MSKPSSLNKYKNPKLSCTNKYQSNIIKHYRTKHTNYQSQSSQNSEHYSNQQKYDQSNHQPNHNIQTFHLQKQLSKQRKRVIQLEQRNSQLFKSLKLLQSKSHLYQQQTRNYQIKIIELNQNNRVNKQKLYAKEQQLQQVRLLLKKEEQYNKSLNEQNEMLIQIKQHLLKQQQKQSFLVQNHIHKSLLKPQYHDEQNYQIPYHQNHRFNATTHNHAPSFITQLQSQNLHLKQYIETLKSAYFQVRKKYTTKQQFINQLQTQVMYLNKQVQYLQELLHNNKQQLINYELFLKWKQFQTTDKVYLLEKLNLLMESQKNSIMRRGLNEGQHKMKSNNVIMDNNRNVISQQIWKEKMLGKLHKYKYMATKYKLQKTELEKQIQEAKNQIQNITLRKYGEDQHNQSQTNY